MSQSTRSIWSRLFGSPPQPVAPPASEKLFTARPAPPPDPPPPPPEPAPPVQPPPAIPVAPPPVAAAPPPPPLPRRMRPDERERHAEIVRLFQSQDYAAAADLCDAFFGARPEVCDTYDHPVHLKESVRIALARGLWDDAARHAAALRPRLPANDPCIEVLFARAHASAGDKPAARAAWQAALTRQPTLAEARRWLAADGHPAAPPGPDISGIADIAYVETTDLAGFGRSAEAQSLTLLASLAPAQQIDLYRPHDLPPDVVEFHHAYRDQPPVRVYAVPGLTLAGFGLLTRESRFFFHKDCVPAYFRGGMERVPHGLPDPWSSPLRSANVVRHIDRPVATVLHPNFVFGHFLLEILPKLFLLGLLKDLGAPFPLVLPAGIRPWVVDFARLYFGLDEIIRYDPVREKLTALSFIIPSMMQEEWHMHPACNLMVADIKRRIGIAATAPAVAGRRIYLSRSRFEGARRLLNEAEIEAMLTGLGFEIVHPQELSLAEQVRLFDAAGVVVSEYNSALHNTLFSRPGTRVVALGWHNWAQSSIARLRQQRLAIVPPADGVFRDWRRTAELGRSFAIDCNALRETLDGFAGPPAG